MKSRVTLSLEEGTLKYLSRRAEAETGGNVSALLERVVQAAAVAESAKQHAAWYAAQPCYAEAAEAERYAA